VIAELRAGANAPPPPSTSEKTAAASITVARVPMMQVLRPRAGQGRHQDPSAAADAVGSPFSSLNGRVLRCTARDYSSAW
jgi:hypothetical protein